MFLFVHIAKTGGSSIRKMLNARQLDYDCIHNGDLIRFRDGRSVARTDAREIDIKTYEQCAYFVRHPFDRILSCYRYFSAGGLNQIGRAYFEHDAIFQQKILAKFSSFHKCCANLSSFSKLVPHARPMIESLQYIEQFDLPVFQGRYETFGNDVSAFFVRSGLSQPDQILNLNKTVVPDEEAKLDLKGCIELVREYYARDFERFSYS